MQQDKQKRAELQEGVPHVHPEFCYMHGVFSNGGINVLLYKLGRVPTAKQWSLLRNPSTCVLRQQDVAHVLNWHRL